jgi:hypothetical protein
MIRNIFNTVPVRGVAIVALEYVNQLAGPYLIILGFGLVILVGILDYFTGRDVGLAIFYLFTGAFVTWFMTRWDGFCVSAVAVLAWVSVESVMDPPLEKRPRAT